MNIDDLEIRANEMMNVYANCDNPYVFQSLSFVYDILRKFSEGQITSRELIDSLRRIAFSDRGWDFEAVKFEFENCKYADKSSVITSRLYGAVTPNFLLENPIRDSYKKAVCKGLDAMAGVRDHVDNYNYFVPGVQFDVGDEFSFFVKNNPELFRFIVYKYITEIRDIVIKYFPEILIPCELLGDFEQEDLNQIYKHDYSGMFQNREMPMKDMIDFNTGERVDMSQSYKHDYSSLFESNPMVFPFKKTPEVVRKRI